MGSNNYADVLDHGFVILRNIAGPTRRLDAEFDADDIDPANVARISFDGLDKARTRDQDLKLADFLMKNKHNTPWEMIEVWLEMKLPIFVARQFVRHRTVSLNEVSARYVTLPKEWYIPELKHIGVKPESVKQGRSLEEHNPEMAQIFIDKLQATCDHSYQEYVEAIRSGVPSELARCFLHMNHYTHWVWKQNLSNLFHFLSLRDHSHAQYEAQAYARAIDSLIRRVLPHSMEVYDKYRRFE